jgi:hypothetical protein
VDSTPSRAPDEAVRDEAGAEGVGIDDRTESAEAEGACEEPPPQLAMRTKTTAAKPNPIRYLNTEE